MTSPPPPRRVPIGTAAAYALLLGAALWLGLRLGEDRRDDASAARAATLDAGAGAGIATLSVRATDGRVLRLAAAGEPTVVMVISETCGVCKEALGDFGETAAGRPLPRLRVVTLEGADRGAPMVRAAGVRGALVAGPVSPAAEALFTFQIRGTPTFLALDAGGRVRRVVPGYPGRDAFAPWIDVMLGERDAP